jgi:UPF0755 protein
LFSGVVKLLGLTSLLAAVVLVVAASVGVVAVSTPLTVPVGGTTVVVAKGTTIAHVGSQLEQAKLLTDRRPLVWFARLTGQAAQIKAGEYAIPAGDTIPALLQRLVRGVTVHYSITFVEGWTFKQMRAALAKERRLKQLTAGLNDAELMARLERVDQHPEGRFFPDTYVFTRGQSDLDVLRRSLVSMDKTLAEAWAARVPKLPYESAYDALIMASIVEKETGAAEERARIAGVFVRRLRKNMKLQTDPTVIYGMGERYDGDIRRKDLSEDTPYNTYVHKGLTPTPIANPGAAAIRAAVNPQPGTALFFVARGDGTGTHDFSDTYAEHKRAVKRYLQRRRGK